MITTFSTSQAMMFLASGAWTWQNRKWLKKRTINDWWINQCLLLHKQMNILDMCSIRSQEIFENVVLFGPVLLQTLEPRAERYYLGSAMLPFLWPQPTASGEHTGSCSCTEGSDWNLHVVPPCTWCPPVSGLPWLPAYFARWIFLVAGHLGDFPQIPQWPSGEHQSKVGNAQIGRLVDVLLCHCQTQCCQPEWWID